MVVKDWIKFERAHDTNTYQQTIPITIKQEKSTPRCRLIKHPPTETNTRINARTNTQRQKVVFYLDLDHQVGAFALADEHAVLERGLDDHRLRLLFAIELVDEDGVLLGGVDGARHGGCLSWLVEDGVGDFRVYF